MESDVASRVGRFRADAAAFERGRNLVNSPSMVAGQVQRSPSAIFFMVPRRIAGPGLRQSVYDRRKLDAGSLTILRPFVIAKMPPAVLISAYRKAGRHRLDVS